MAEEIEVSIDDKKDEPQVSFVESDDATMVHIGEDKKDKDDDRWRTAEANQNRLASDLESIRSRLAGGSSAPQASSPTAPDPWKAQEDAISEQERALGIQWEAHKASGQLARQPQLLTDYDTKARALQQQRHDLSAQRAVQNAMPHFIQASQAQQFRNQYGDVHANPNANRYARGQYDMLVAQGHPDSAATVEVAMNAARRQFGLGGARSQPNDRDRDQLTGYSNTRRTNMDPKSNVVKMGKSEKVMAMAMYGNAFNGDEKKVYSQWAKGPGIRAQKAAQKARSATR